MSTAQFTPGPWEARDTCSQQERWVVGADHPYSDSHKLAVAREIETEANARLIAAAPELYEALDELTRSFRLIYEVNGDDPDHTTVFPKAAAALAKARGEQ